MSLISLLSLLKLMAFATVPCISLPLYDTVPAQYRFDSDSIPNSYTLAAAAPDVATRGKAECAPWGGTEA